MKPSEFNKAIESGKAQVLTLERAKALKGKKILWSYFGYESNAQVVFEMTVGDIISSWDYNKTQPLKGYASRTAYWETYMDAYQKSREKGKLILLDEGKDNSYVYCYTGPDNCFDELTFTCSDADRAVFFIECDED